MTNHTHLGDSSNGSTATYACGGHPEQPAVPLPRVIEGQLRGLRNWLVSPPISITEDVHGTPVVDPAWIVLEFDVYRDFPPDNFVFYTFHVRSITGTNASEWRTLNGSADPAVIYGSPGSADWFRFQRDVLALIDPGAEHIQVALEVLDMCPFWCGIFEPSCHSHAPLFDNVRVVADAGTVTGVKVPWHPDPTRVAPERAQPVQPGDDDHLRRACWRRERNDCDLRRSGTAGERARERTSYPGYIQCPLGRTKCERQLGRKRSVLLQARRWTV